MTRGVAVAMTLLLAGVLAAGCGTASGTAELRSVVVRVAVAASLRDAADALADAYAATHPGIGFEIATGSSAALRTQVEQGAPIDVFLSADEANPAALARAGLLAGAPIPIASNGLVLVVPVGNPAGIASPVDLARPGVRVIAAGEAVPITGYARRLLERLAAGTTDPAAFLAAVDANVASREDDVAAVLARIELGEGDAAVVYATDARDNPRVVAIPVPGADDVRAAYAGGVVAASHVLSEARAFLDWVAGPEGQAVLGRRGFRSP